MPAIDADAAIRSPATVSAVDEGGLLSIARRRHRPRQIITGPHSVADTVGVHRPSVNSIVDGSRSRCRRPAGCYCRCSGERDKKRSAEGKSEEADVLRR